MAYPETINDIVDWTYSNAVLNVKAYLQDMIQTFQQTRYDPPEYGPGLAEVTLFLGDDLDSAPPSAVQSSSEVLDLLKEYDPISWQIVDEY
jgi:hypothetical protein